MSDIHKGDIGTVITATIVDESGTAVNLAGATSKKIIFQKPDGSRAEKDLAFATDGTDGKVKYTLLAGDVDQSGGWQRQYRVSLAAGTWTSDVVVFDVKESI
jgi:hypothetical protein